MNPIKQRIAIAEACGWTIIDFTTETKIPECILPKTIYWDLVRQYKPHPSIPDYLTDLNALAEARKALINTLPLRIKWVNALRTVVGRSCEKNKVGHAVVSDVDLLFADAPQLREALLKTLDLWIKD